jgi:DNA repair protein RadC
MNRELIKAAIKEIENTYIKSEASFTRCCDAKDYFRLRIGFEEVEVFEVAFLDTQHKLIKAERMFTGTIDGASVYPREIVKVALLNNAKAIIISHNHPGGSIEPSEADIQLTKRVEDACRLLDIALLDHLIVSKLDSMSFAERGLL